jgi:hypothetical protein
MLLGLYKHYKGGRYFVIGIARHTETLEELVVYQSLYGDYGIWVRPLKMFQEKVEHEGNLVDRFTYMGNPKEKAPDYR